MSDNQLNESQPQPTESEPQTPSVTMEIEKQPKGTKTTKPKAYLDDHVHQYGQNLISSIATLINQSKEADKPKKKKKKMTPEMLEQCRRNLAKGRETIRRTKEIQAKGKSVAPKSAPKSVEAKPVALRPEPPKAVLCKPIPAPVPQQEPKQEQLTVRLSDLLL